MAIEFKDIPVKKQVFLGEKVIDSDYKNLVEQFAQRFLNDVLSEPDGNEKVNNLNVTIGKFSNGIFDNVSSVEAAAVNSEPNAMIVRDLVCDGLYLSMREGGIQKYVDALNTGDVLAIESVLPKDLQPWGREVRNRHIDNSNITAVLDQITYGRFTRKEDKILQLQAAGRILESLKGVDPFQLNLARNAVGVLFDEFDNPQIVVSSGSGQRVERPKIAPIGSENLSAGENESMFKVTLPAFADALRDGGQVRFDYSDLPIWALHNEIKDPIKRAEAVSRECARYHVHNLAERKSLFGNGDFQKMRTDTNFEFKGKDLKVYFDKDTQLTGQMMVGDLMEFYIKSNGIKMLVFKNEENSIKPTKYVNDRMLNLDIYVSEIALRLQLYKNLPRKTNEDENTFRSRITEESNKWFDRALTFRKDNLGGMLEFPINVGYQEKLSAYSMREFMFMSLAFSQADRHRMFTPITRAIQDPERYVLWMQQKLKRKVGADGKEDRKLLAKEWKHAQAETATQMQLWVQNAMDIEEVLGKPLDGVKYVADKIFDGEIVLGPENLCIGYMDILSVTIIDDNGKIKMEDISDEKKKVKRVEMKRTLSEALVNKLSFTTNSDDNDTMAPFRDAMEQGGDAFAYFKGSPDKSFPQGKGDMAINFWIQSRNKVLGLTKDINQNGKPVFTDALRNSAVIESLMLGVFGVDMNLYAAGRPIILLPQSAIGIESEAIDNRVDAMRLVSDWADTNDVKVRLKGYKKQLLQGVAKRLYWINMRIKSRAIIDRYQKIKNRRRI